MVLRIDVWLTLDRAPAVAWAAPAKLEAAPQGSRASSAWLQLPELSSLPLDSPPNTTCTSKPRTRCPSAFTATMAWAPNPPNFYRQFTDANITRLEDLKNGNGSATTAQQLLNLPPELRYLIPPEPPA